MTQDNSSEILTDGDVFALFTAFPELKQKFPRDAGKDTVMSFMDEKAKECGLEQGAQQVLEYTAVAIAMKLRAKIALGELKEDDLALIKPELREDILNKAEKFKQHKGQKTVVGQGVCMDIRDMDFNKALSILPLQDKISRTFYKVAINTAEGGELLQGDDSYKFTSLTSISGNETASGKSLRKGEFSETIEYRLTNGSIESGDDNDIFKTFASLYLTANALQGQAFFKLGEKFPEHFDFDDKKNIDFFSMHPAEAIMVCADARIPDNKRGMELAKQLVQIHSSPESTFDSKSGILEAYAETDLLRGNCPVRIDRLQQSIVNLKAQTLDTSRRETGMPMYASMPEGRA